MEKGQYWYVRSPSAWAGPARTGNAWTVEEGASGLFSSTILVMPLVFPRVPWAGPPSLAGAEGLVSCPFVSLEKRPEEPAGAEVDLHGGRGEFGLQVK